MRLAAVIVLYNPKEEVLDCIKSYYDVVDKIYVIDNSDKINLNIVSILEKMSKIKYISNGKNKGIAFALNIGATNAIRDKFIWLLTMDQDSRFTSRTIRYLIEGLEELKNDRKLAIISANYLEACYKDRSSSKYSYKDTVIQSGSIINLKIYRKIKGYANELFIDEVDFDYCYCCKEKKYKIIKVNSAIMQHNRGNIKKNGNGFTWNYPPIRYYYIIRNRIYVYRKHKLFLGKLNGISQVQYINLNQMVKMVCKEDEKYKKLLAICLGIIDAIQNRMGKCSWRILS